VLKTDALSQGSGRVTPETEARRVYFAKQTHIEATLPEFQVSKNLLLSPILEANPE
jgi:hypothetical protein